MKTVISIMNKNESNDNRSIDSIEIMRDLRYVQDSCALITEALRQGKDVVQYVDGNIDISEMRPIIYQYNWDQQKETLIKKVTGGYSRRVKLKTYNQVKTC